MPTVECAKQGHILMLLVMVEFIQDVTETGRGGLTGKPEGALRLL